MLKKSFEALQNSTNSVQKELNDLRTIGKGSRLYNGKILSLNERMSTVERGFTSQEGLFSRPWFKHVIVAPGADLGYSYELFPGVMEAMRLNNYLQVRKSLQQLANSINTAALILV